MSQFHSALTVPMAVAEDLITSSPTYKAEILNGLRPHEAISVCLHHLGMNLDDVNRNFGYIRTAGNLRVGYQGGYYIGNTRADFEYKHLYEDISCLAPVNVPRGKTRIDLESLGEELAKDQRSQDEKADAKEEQAKTKNRRKPRGQYKKKNKVNMQDYLV